MSGLWHTLHWREPLNLWFSLLPLAIYVVQRIRNRRDLNQYADAHLHAWVVVAGNQTLWQQFFSRNTAYVMGWLLCVAALAGPRIAVEIPEGTQRNGLDVMVVVDTSRSMHASDVQPNRLRRAQIELHTFLGRAAGNRAGLIVYAAKPHLFAPLTYDYHALSYYLDLIDGLMMPTHGSDAEAALALAQHELHGSAAKGVVLWLTDGDFSGISATQKSALEKRVQEIASTGQHLYILGLGTEEGEPLRDATGKWLEYELQAVVSRMDARYLARLAAMGDGVFSKLSDTDYEWDRLYDRGMMTQTQLALNAEQARHVIWKEYYPWPLLPGLALLLVAVTPYRLTFKRHGATLALVVFLVMILAPYKPGQAASLGDERAAYAAFVRQDFIAAAQLYNDVPGYAGRFGEAVSLYRHGDFSNAVRQFGQAALQAETDVQRQRALFDLGDSYFRLGDYQSATEVFKDVLRYNPRDTNASQNLQYSELLQRLVRERTGEDASLMRQGRGARSARAASGMEIHEHTSISLGDPDQKPTESKPTVIPSNENDTSIQSLVNKGVEHVQLAAEGKVTVQDYHRLQTLSYVKSQLSRIEEARVRVFQRLFEMEEGFPAPLDETQSIPGVVPW